MSQLNWLGFVPIALGFFFILTAPYSRSNGHWGGSAVRPENRVPISPRGKIAWGIASTCLGLCMLAMGDARLSRIANGLALLSLAGLFIVQYQDRRNFRRRKN